MKKYLCLICLALLAGCDKQAEKQASAPPAVEPGNSTKDAGSSRRDVSAPAGEEHYNRIREERARRFLSEPGPPGYMAIRDEVWKVGEAGVTDYSNDPNYMEMVKTKDLNYRMEHDPKYVFEGKLSHVIQDAKKESPELRFRIGYLIILRYATRPKDGVSLWQTEWNHIGPSHSIVFNAVKLMREASGEDLEHLAEFSDEFSDFAEKWMEEHPFPKE
ncbi:hypothetical protein [Luteolibacter sp.]|uniref:hypothetical protein n=1 Tax=Luteolibacter sp. TaxID=1962973 RepID=UPI00326565F0